MSITFNVYITKRIKKYKEQKSMKHRNDNKAKPQSIQSLKLINAYRQNQNRKRDSQLLITGFKKLYHLILLTVLQTV